MLTHLQLRDLAIVDHVELEFGPGLTALTGETGAGKSIIVDALLLAAGGRAGPDVVRHGCARAEVAASFSVPAGGAMQWLQDQSIDPQDEVILRRVISADGRSRAYINGQVVSLQALREFADFVLEVHGQQEFQHLIKRSAQRDLLDAHSVPQPLIEAVANLYASYRTCHDQLDALSAAAASRDSRLDYLRFQLTELKSDVGTREQIEQVLGEQKRFANRGKLAFAAQTALAAIYDGEGSNAHDLLAKADGALRSHAQSDLDLAAAVTLLGEAQFAVSEATTTIQRYLEALDVDPARQEELERRAANLEALARKHRVGVLELPAQLLATEEELHRLESSAVLLADLQGRLGLLGSDYTAAAAELTRTRQAAASDLSREVTNRMQALGMVGGHFEIRVDTEAGEFSAHGIDHIDFLVSANPGQPVKSLAKVASGGELSRMSLAIQVAAASQQSALCMVFDEVDAGVGGAVAEIVGRQLRNLGDRAQVLCVTHLAQVASQAHRHFRVVKLSDGKTTRTAVNQLGSAERVEEVARMLGGISVSDTARDHAREMLNATVAQSPPKKPKSRRAAT